MLFAMLRDFFESNESETFRFMDEFAGVQIFVPSHAAINRVRNERRIEKALARDCSTGAVRRLGDHLEGGTRFVCRKFARSAGHGVEEERRRRGIPLREGRDNPFHL